MTSVTGSPTSASSSSRTRVTPARALLNRVPPHGRQTAGGSSPHRAQCSAVVGLLDGRRAAVAAGQLAAGRAGEQPGPAGAVQHAQHPPVGSQQADEGRREQPGPARVLVAPVDDLDGRPPGPLAGAVGREQVAPRQRLQGRARARQHARHAGPPRPLDGDVAGVPRRRLLLLVGLVVLVEHDDRGQVGDGRPRRGPGADDRRAGCPERPAARGAAATATPARRRRAPTVAAMRRRRAQDEGVAERRGRRGHVHEVGGRREPEHRPRPREGARQQLVVRATRRRRVGGGAGSRATTRSAMPSAGTTRAGRPSATPPSGPGR